MLTVVFLGIFWWLSVYGVKHVETDLSVQKLALPESPIVSFKKTYDEALKVSVVLKYFYIVELFE